MGNWGNGKLGHLAGWPILNFAPFAKFRVGTFEAYSNQTGSGGPFKPFLA